MHEITTVDQDLITASTEAIRSMFSEKKHRLATTILTEDGRVITGINVEGSFGCNDVCAEQITLGKALSEGHTAFKTVVTVKHPKPDDDNQSLRVVSPCGKCRELLMDYAPDIWVIVRQGDQLQKVQIKDLLPFRYSK